MKRPICSLVLTVVLVSIFMICGVGAAWAQYEPVVAVDQTPTTPLANPVPSSFQPRYISGFGQDDTFTVFFEDRDASNKISFASTTSGPGGFPASATATNISDTHFCVKDWPINIGGTDYAYRAWGAVGNNLQHHFYVSNDLTNWILVSTFTIPNAPGFTDAHGRVYYGFHDVILLNGTYYAFAESNQSQTMLVRSANGDDVWEAFASVGGRPGWGPLELPSGVSSGWTPSGSFVDLGYDRGYGKIYADPRDSNFYLAINTAAKASLDPADLESAFINPANWTWHDGTTGPAANPIISETSEHDLRECWGVPNSNPQSDWVIIYDADFGAADGGKALGYLLFTPPPPPPPPPQKGIKQEVRDDLAALLPTGDKKTDKGFEKAIEHIDRGLDAELWYDDSHLTKKGNKVYDEEKRAVEELMKIVKGGGSFAGDAQSAIDTLVSGDQTLAEIAYDQAQAFAGDAKVDKELQKCDEEFARAVEELAEGHPDKAIDHYKHAWEHAQHALEHASK